MNRIHPTGRACGFSAHAIKSWPLMSLAAKETGTNLSSISSCCTGKCKSANGFIWKKDIETLNKKAGDY